MTRLTYAGIPRACGVVPTQPPNMPSIDLNQLKPFTKYIWWKTPEESLEFPERLIAQVMDIGVFEDTMELINTLGEDTLRYVIKNAQAGWFEPRSWHYWHYRLGLAENEKQIPELPKRKFYATLQTTHRDTA